MWLAGDPKQNRAVQRGEPFGLLQERAGLTPSRISKIMRQKKAPYRKLVESARDGAPDVIDRLRGLGWVREVPDAERYKVLAADYLEATRKERRGRKWREPTALVVAASHAAGAKVAA